MSTMSEPTKRELALRNAIARIGVHEQPPGSNRGPLIDAWNRAANGIVGEPWCMSFVHAMYANVGVELGGWAGVQNFVHWSQQHGYAVTRPLRGDIVCFDWNADRWYDHVGIVERVLALGPGRRAPYTLATVEGNTGDAVRRRRRMVVRAVFARVPA